MRNTPYLLDKDLFFRHSIHRLKTFMGGCRPPPYGSPRYLKRGGPPPLNPPDVGHNSKALVNNLR